MLFHGSGPPPPLLLPSALHYHVSRVQVGHSTQRHTLWRDTTKDNCYGKQRSTDNWLFTAGHPGDLTGSREAVATLGATPWSGFVHCSLIVRSQLLSASSTETVCSYPILDSSYFGSLRASPCPLLSTHPFTSALLHISSLGILPSNSQRRSGNLNVNRTV